MRKHRNCRATSYRAPANCRAISDRVPVLTALVLCGAAWLAAAPHAHALKFANQFVEFELPSAKWNCALEGAEWVCQSTDDQRKRDAIVVLAAKLKGDQDTLDKYQEYLTKPRTFSGPTGQPVASKPKYARVSQVNGHPWVDSLHLESEIPGFFTRYLGTVKEDIGVLVTYSINKNKYQEYLTQFDDMVKSLKVFRKKGGINTGVAQNIFDQAKLPGSFTAQSAFPEQEQAPAEPAKTAKPKGEDDNMMLLLLVGAAVVGFLIWKKKRGGGA